MNVIRRYYQYYTLVGKIMSAYFNVIYFNEVYESFTVM